MLITKRDGSMRTVQFDAIANRLHELCEGLNGDFINVEELAHKVISGMTDGMTTSQVDQLAAETAATMTTYHPDYTKLAARIAVSNLHKETSSSFSNVMRRLYLNTDPATSLHAPLISASLWKVVRQHSARLDSCIRHDLDFDYDYFGFKTLEKSYLMRQQGKIVERPQYLLMRVALGIHGDDIDAALESYTLFAERWFTHATPTLFNAGTPQAQMSSCFLLQMKDDSIDGIYDTLKQCARISQTAGGIGLSIHNVRAKGSYIRGTGGHSNGIVPMLRNFEMTARYVDQGGGRRKGSFAIYLEPWHADIHSFLELKRNHGKEELRARDLFYALWIPDLFMKRVEDNGMWSLFCPNECPGLSEVWGEQFEALYTSYERHNKARSQVKAQDLWHEIVTSQIETGTPYMLYKDTANRKSNQKNLGTIKSSNLCTEIIEYTAPDEVAVCNLASISLPRFIQDGKIDHAKLHRVTKVATFNLNKIIDVNDLPLLEAQRSNLRHRPIGLGVQGLADVFMLLDIPFDSEEARQLNRDIFETMYYAAMEASMELARQHEPYSTYHGSPISKGIFQFDQWGVTPDSGRWNWQALKAHVRKHGVRNSLLVAPMPTASTSQILGNNECFEPYTSNIYMRRTLAGEFIVVNRHLMNKLTQLQLWNDSMRQAIIAANGSIQDIDGIPAHVKAVYRTVWEISQKSIIDMSADRGAYVCQSQSLNIHLRDPNFARISSMHFYGWKKGLKTGMYYLRTTAAAQAIKFTIDKDAAQAGARMAEQNRSDMTCSLDNPEGLRSV